MSKWIYGVLIALFIFTISPPLVSAEQDIMTLIDKARENYKKGNYNQAEDYLSRAAKAIQQLNSKSIAQLLPVTPKGFKLIGAEGEELEGAVVEYQSLKDETAQIIVSVFRIVSVEEGETDSAEAGIQRQSFSIKGKKAELYFSPDNRQIDIDIMLKNGSVIINAYGFDRPDEVVEFARSIDLDKIEAALEK